MNLWFPVSLGGDACVNTGQMSVISGRPARAESG